MLISKEIDEANKLINKAEYQTGMMSSPRIYIFIRSQVNENFVFRSLCLKISGANPNFVLGVYLVKIEPSLQFLEMGV